MDVGQLRERPDTVRVEKVSEEAKRSERSFEWWNVTHVGKEKTPCCEAQRTDSRRNETA
jgi:hypothetical protein